jgi:hypothetical protein
LKYNVEIAFTEPLLASSPEDPKVYEQFIASRKRTEAEERGEEVDTLPAEIVEKVGSSVFHRDATGLFLYDYKLRGFFKEAAAAVTGKGGITGYKSKIDKWVFVTPRRLYLQYNGAVITKADGTAQRPVRAMTAQGPRIALKKSEFINPGTHFSAEILVLPLGEKEITEQRIREWLEYGKLTGIGEWRTGSYGRFDFHLKS